MRGWEAWSLVLGYLVVDERFDFRGEVEGFFPLLLWWVLRIVC